mmetsp:Transcript_141014/g.270665  ORF Transcript_141014/g.270665 Transcript_141014/m.270665 type:complete len:481 (+) Transcript_141014:58-1500(+)
MKPWSAYFTMGPFITFLLLIRCVDSRGLENAAIIPNSIARSGQTMDAVLVMPPPGRGFQTLQVVLKVPNGIRAIRPAQQSCWNPSVLSSSSQEPVAVIFRSTCTSIEEQKPAKIRFQADLGCKFANASESTEWQGRHALWWRTEQNLQPLEANLRNPDLGKSLQWTSVPESSSEKGAGGVEGQRLAPYTFVTSDNACGGPASGRADGAGQKNEAGMLWLGVRIPPAAAQQEDKQDQTRLVAELTQENIADEERISRLEAENQKLRDSMKRVDAETDRSFDGLDRKKHDHSRDHRKGRQHAEAEVSQQFGMAGPPFADQETEPHASVHHYFMKHARRGGGRVTEDWKDLLKVVALLVVILVVVALVAAAVGCVLMASARTLLTSTKLRRGFEPCSQTLLNEAVVPSQAAATKGAGGEGPVFTESAVHAAAEAAHEHCRGGFSAALATSPSIRIADPCIHRACLASLQPRVVGAGGEVVASS